jgi:hypothetical protein
MVPGFPDAARLNRGRSGQIGAFWPILELSRASIEGFIDPIDAHNHDPTGAACPKWLGVACELLLSGVFGGVLTVKITTFTCIGLTAGLRNGDRCTSA